MVVVHRSFRARECYDRALVLTAMGIENEFASGLAGWRLLVPQHEADRAREQLRLYELENRPRFVPRTDSLAHPGAVASVLGYALLLLAVFALQSRSGFGIDWTFAGRVDVAAIRDGAVWRAITALTLHADISHLLANLGFGAFFGALLAREVGPGLGWLMILMAGATGNLVNAAVQQPEHTAVGASTAVFAALGLLAAYWWTGKRLIREGWARRWAPVVGGIWLLTWLGTGDERTDIVAHLTGFVAGFVIGIMLGRSASPRPGGTARQWMFGALTIACLIGAWGLALRGAATPGFM